MREELIINGQHCDLGAESGITLEYVSNLLNDPGKISLSHSYTVKLPRTANNARILDLPEIPAHESSMARRYLPAYYYRNGINLIGDNAQAYITSATDEQYELVLVWDDIPELRTLSESKATLNDLPGLPILPWVGNSYGAETAGALFAKYVSSNVADDTAFVNDRVHPCMRMTNLLQRILRNADVPCELLSEGLDDVVILAAPNHKPDEQMIRDTATKIKSGLTPAYFSQYNNNYALLIGDITIESPLGRVDYYRPTSSFMLDDVKSCKVSVHFKIDSEGTDITDHEGVKLRFVASNNLKQYPNVVLAELPLMKEPSGYVCRGDVDIELPDGFIGIAAILYSEADKRLGGYLYPYGSTTSLFEILIAFDDIHAIGSGIFPLSGNLPDIEQWAFIRDSMLLGGLTPVVSRSTLRFYATSEILDVTRAVDWSEKLYVSEAVKVRPSLGNTWVRHNHFKFKEDESAAREPGFSVDIADETLKTDRDWATLDFAASMNNTAVHYVSNDGGSTYEDVDIEPRFFKYDAATTSLNFTQDLYGEGLKAKYAALQAALEKPVVIEATVRLTEIDLATLDITRPVYLAQFGRYYHVLKVQSGKTDACKVELLQL